MSRKVVANLVGRSEEWLRLVESGRRKLDSIELLARLAEVLQVDDPTELIDWPTAQIPRFHDRGYDDLRPLREVIVDHPALRIHLDYDPASEFDLPALAQTLQQCRDTWDTSPRRLTELARVLPAALVTSRAARWQLQDLETAELLVQAYHLARQLLTACGDHSMAATVADRAMGTAAQVHHPLLVAASAWHVGNALLSLSYTTESHDYVLTAAARLAGDMPCGKTEATIWGALHLMAARSAATARDLPDTEKLLNIAEHTARSLGNDMQAYAIPFGPTEIGITTIEIALTKHDPDEVIRLAPEVHPADDYLLGRRARYHICQASAYVSRREDVSAVLALTNAAGISPDDIRHDPDVHRCLHYLLRRDNYLVRKEVHHLAQLAAVA